MAVFEVTIDSIFVREADFDFPTSLVGDIPVVGGFIERFFERTFDTELDDLDTEWRLDFFVEGERVFQFSDDNVEDGDFIRVDRTVTIEAGRVLSLETSGFEEDPVFNDSLPGNRTDVVALDDREFDILLRTDAENDDFAYVVTWLVSSQGDAAPTTTETDGLASTSSGSVSENCLIA